MINLRKNGRPRTDCTGVLHRRIALRLREGRKDRGLTQETLALAIGVITQTVSRYEKGEFSLSAVRLVQVAQALDLPLSYLRRESGGQLMPSMRVSLPGLFANIKAALRKDERSHYSFALDEVLEHLKATVAGEHTLDEFAEHYCLKDRNPSAGG